MKRLRAWHPESGSVMSAEIVEVVGLAPRRSFKVIPDGLLEQVILREGTWTVALVDETAEQRRWFNEGALAGMALDREHRANR